MFARNHRQKHQREWILWGLPIGMVAIAGLLIASTQRQADYADWYHHWITAGVGVVVALILERLPLQRLKPFLLPIFGLTVASLVAVRRIAPPPLAPNAGSALEAFMFNHRNSPKSRRFFFLPLCSQSIQWSDLLMSYARSG